MPKFETLFSKYDRLVLFDTETTGLAYNRDDINEFAAVLLQRVHGTPKGQHPAAGLQRPF